MKTVRLSEGSHEVLVEQIAELIGHSIKGPRLTRARDILNKFRLQGDSVRETAFDTLADALEVLLDAEESPNPEPTPTAPEAIGAPITITLPPRVAASYRFEAFCHERDVMELILHRLANSVRDVSGELFEHDTDQAIEWLLGAPAKEEVAS